MLTKGLKRIKHPDKTTLEAVSEAFKEIEAYFELMGFAPDEKEVALAETLKENAENEHNEEDDGGIEEYEDEDEYDDEETLGGVYDREEVEVAIDVFISRLVDEGIVKKIRGTPTLLSVFERIFGDGHEIIGPVREFQEDTEGYFDAINHDDMLSAYEDVVAIRKAIIKEMK